MSNINAPQGWDRSDAAEWAPVPARTAVSNARHAEPKRPSLLSRLLGR